jgi:hypothetical protein
MYRLPNGGVTDGLTRLLACVQSGCPFWTLVYIAADPEDFQYYDESQSSRSNKDYLLNSDLELKPSHASIESQYLPKVVVMFGGNSDVSHTQVTADQFLEVKDNYPEETAAATEFVTKHKDLRRKPMIALVHFDLRDLPQRDHRQRTGDDPAEQHRGEQHPHLA